ncbi:hypothetical protein UlMin_003948, partial [Ulmus minor]
SVIDEGNQIRERIKLLFERASHLRLNLGVPTRSLQRVPAPLVGNESDVFGRDGDKKKIIELLLSDDAGGRNLSVIPIVGLGGIGKTTLAQLVYKDSRVRKHFNSKAWVTVSEVFDVSQITKRIYKEATSQECQTDDVFVLQSKLNEVLRGKRFLFVLDDVWNEKYELWDGLKSAFESGARGSKVIVTTRSKEVALTMSMGVMHELKLVSDQDCWRIFEKHVFEDSAKAPAQLQQIGREIVKRCRGLPLAVKSLAGLLRCTSKPKEWRKILNSDIWQLQFQTDLKKQVVPAVWLSYQFLPPYLKRCFAYLSVFPKDYLFDMKKIIWLWMAEGLLEAENGKKAEEVGEEYLQALIGRSFFQYSSQDESTEEEPNKLIMHDIVHDLAMFLSGEFSFVVHDSSDLSNLPTKACHLSISTEQFWVSEKIMKGIMHDILSQTRSLRTLLLLSWSYSRPILEKSLLHDLFLKVGGCLRVLSLSHSNINKLPDSIGNMKYLRYLDLSSTTITELPDSIGNMKYLSYLDLSDTTISELPDSICTLYNLHTLLLRECYSLGRLPTRLAALVNLCHLDLSYTSDLEEMPSQMCKLKSLQTLGEFVLGENGGRRIRELGEFPLLGGRLRISGLEHVVDVQDVLEANLKNKESLNELILVWGCDSNITSPQQERKVLEALRPHTNLKQLEIRGYRGTIFPDWVGHESFCNMVQVVLFDCRNVCMLPPLGQLSSLRRLLIEDLDSVVRIGNEFCVSSSTTTNRPFTSLEVLSIEGMKSWEEWSFSSDRLGQEGGVFPSLTQLSIFRCEKLIVGLPDCRLPSLESISISRCDEMVGVFVEMDTNAFPSLESTCLLCIIKVCFEMVGVCQSRQEMDTTAFPSLKLLDVDECPRLESLWGRHSFPSNLEVLEITACKKLWENRMKWGLERLPSLMTLVLSGLGIEEEVDSFPEEGLLLPTTLTHLSIHHFEKLKGLKAFQHLTSLRDLTIWSCGELECLPQDGLPLSLSCLTIEDCPVLKQ